MRKRKIYVTDKDLQRLKSLIKSTAAFSDNMKRDISKLKVELDSAKIVASTKIPPKVITMHSMVCLIDNDTGKEMTWRLVYPKEAKIEQGRISILAPLGMAILGYFEGDTIEWDVPSGRKSFTVKSVLYQPEASGDFSL